MFSTRLSLVAICVLRFASPVHSLHAKRSVEDAELIARAFEINAGAVFPHQADKRGLLGTILGGVGNGVDTLLNDVGGGVNTLLGGGAVAAATSTVAAVVNPTTTAANNNNGGGNTAAPATTTAANGSGSGSGNGGNSNANNDSGTTSAVNNGNNNNGNSNGNGANTNNANGSGAASASGSGNSANGGTVPMNAMYTGSGAITVAVLTDHSGHTITTTGTAPITLTYVTTLPNGVVSTVTEVITPTAEVFGEPVVTHSSASRIGAIAGSIVALFLVFFIIAFVLLMLRKRRRRIQLANSRPESTLSFGSSDILNHRNSTEPLEPTGSMTSFRTAPAYVDGQKMDFPLPPAPSADLNHNEMAGTSQRPISMGSDLTNDLMERRSRTSIIAERNLFRKVGQYPDAGSYTPFALAPSSELGHSEEAFDHNNAYEGTSNIKEFHENYRRSRNLDFAPSVHENPFNDPAHVAQPAAPVPAASNQRQSGLWRKATFGSSQQPPSKRLESHPPSSFAQPHVDTFGRKSSTASADRGTVVSHASSDYETATETQSKHSSGGYSYHSAFARYASDPTAENPFADSNGLEPGSPPPSSRLLTSAAGWRPATAGSTASLSVMSSTGNSARELGSTPDPKDLFYHPPSTGQSVRPGTAASQPPRPWTAESTRVSEDNQTEETVRQKNIAYPSLSGVVQQMQARR